MNNRMNFIFNDNVSRGQKKETVSKYFNDEVIGEVLGFHKKIPCYKPTPLESLPALAQRIGISSLYVKDESKRFGLNAFKVLGGSYAIAKYLAERLEKDINELSFEYLASEECRNSIGDLIFVTATDGNHGRGVAWFVEQIGQKAFVFMPKGSTKARAESIRYHGAECYVTEGNYDETVRHAYKYCELKGGIFVQDTAWPGYEDIPTWIMQGYMTLAFETWSQLKAEYHKEPTHVILQAGVGSFACAVMGLFLHKMAAPPRFILIEPEQAHCLYLSAAQNDGTLKSVKGQMKTLMAGLACGEPNTVSWPLIRDNATCFVSANDHIATNGMRILAAPKPRTDPVIVSGESGAIGLGLIYELMSNRQYREEAEMLKIGQDSVVLVISTEGDTSPDIYEDVVWRGRSA